MKSSPTLSANDRLEWEDLVLWTHWDIPKANSSDKNLTDNFPFSSGSKGLHSESHVDVDLESRNRMLLSCRPH